MATTDLGFDRYGFLIDERNLEAAQRLEDPSIVRKENERLLKWQDMFTNWEHFTTRKLDKLEQRTWKGVPDPVRSEVWKRASSVSTATTTRKYFTLLAEPIDPQYKALLEGDVLRTFPTHEFFHKHTDPNTANPGHESLKNVLRAYCSIDKECGYVQGMSYIAAIPLFYLVEEDAFWVFVFLMMRAGYRQYFLPGTPNIINSVQVLQTLVHTHLPKLANRFREENIELSAFVSPWFLTVFTKCLPFPVSLRCWDWLFITGHDSLHAVALTIFKIKQHELLALSSDDLVETIMKMANEVDVDPLEFIKVAQSFRTIPKQVKSLRIEGAEQVLSDEERKEMWESAISV